VLVDAIPALRRLAGSASNRPDTLLADRGYDAEHLRHSLTERGIEPRIVRRRLPGRGRARDPQTRQRWTIERTNAWLHSFRRVSVRYERRAELYLALTQLACSLILCRYLEQSF
jgi:transposase